MEKNRKNGKNPETEKNEKELGLVVSQQTAILHPAKTQLPQKQKTSIREIFWGKKGRKKIRKMREIPKKKKTKKN